MTLLTRGDLTLAAGASLTPSGVVTLDVEGGHLVNNAGAGVFSSGGVQVPSRFLIYALDSGGTTNLGGLTAASQSGVSYPSDPKGSGNALYLSSSAPPILITTIATTTIPTTTIATTNLERSGNSCTGSCSVGVVTVTSVTSVGNIGPTGADPQQAAFNTAAANDWSAQFALGLIQQNWSATSGGYNQDAVEQYALALCEQSGSTSCAKNPGTAMIAVMTDLQNGSLSEDAILAFGKLRGQTGWGSAAFGTTAAFNTSPAVNVMLSGLWQSATSPQNIGSTSTLVEGLLAKLKPGDPGYGESLGSALANLGNPNDPVTQGLQTGLLLTQASAIAQKQATGQSLTPTEQNFANALAKRMLEQKQATLNQVYKDFQTVQQINAPTGINLGTLLYYGTPAPDGLKNEVLSGVPGSASTPGAFSNAATTTSRMLDALGTAPASSSNSTGTSTETAGTNTAALGATMAGSLTAVASFAGVTVTGATVGAGASAATSLGVSAVAGMGSTIATAAAAAAGPAAIALAGVAILASAAAQVADIQGFVTTLAGQQIQVANVLAQNPPPTLSSLLNVFAPNSGMPLMLYSLTQMVTGTGVQTPRPVTS